MNCRTKACNSQEGEVRKGPWTMEEDLILINHIANHGEGAWNSLAKAAGLKRTGKSCRLRWLNYLRPGVRRGNITAEEELLIMELHAKWGNRWSKIAKHLPGRTDNEIKNYWRTKIQKQIKQGDHHANSPSELNNNNNNNNNNKLMEMIQEQASTSTQMSYSTTPSDHFMVETTQLCTTSCHHGATNMMMHDIEAASQSHPYSNNWPNIDESTTENYWSMEDIWSMQLLN